MLVPGSDDHESVACLAASVGTYLTQSHNSSIGCWHLEVMVMKALLILPLLLVYALHNLTTAVFYIAPHTQGMECLLARGSSPNTVPQ